MVASATDAASAAIPTASGAAVAFLRKLIYRAAGDEGLAQNIHIPGESTFAQQQQQALQGSPDNQNSIQNFFRNVNRTVYRTEYQSVPCVDTSGQAFAIYLNLIYLAPLTILFMRFFFKSYLRRTSSGAKHQSKFSAASKATRDATHGIEREIESFGKSAENGISSALDKSKEVLRGRKSHINGSVKDERYGSLSPANKKSVDRIHRRVDEELLEDDLETSKEAKQIAKEVVSKVEETKKKVEEQVHQGKDDAKPEQKKQNGHAKGSK